MNDANLPKHVIEKLERRWAVKLTRDAVARQSERPLGPTRHKVGSGNARLVPVNVKRGSLGV